MNKENSILKVTAAQDSVIRNGANWFYWIAALSLINSLILHGGGNMSFMFGLAFTQLIDSFLLVFFQAIANPETAEAVSTATEADFQGAFATVVETTPIHIKAIIILFDLVPISIFALFGLFANKYKKWAFIAGLVLFGIDTLLFLGLGDFLGLAIHVYAMFAIFKAYKTLTDAEKSQEWEADLNDQPLEAEYETM